MSAIFGIFNLDGKPISPASIDRMRKALSHRGPDGSGVWHDGSIALGHQMMHITPESLSEKLPFRNVVADLVITANARIDNRDELFQVLGIAHVKRAEIPDSTLILRAYEKWGEGCLTHLLGDFAFAIWDGRNRKLFCANDQMGVRPILYCQNGGRFIFASEVKGILAVEGVPKVLNKKKVASLAFPQLGADDDGMTFFEAVFTLPKATSMRVDAKGVRTQTYWEPTLSTKLDFKTDAEYLEAFRDLFFQAVNARLRSAFPVTSLLSGGLDSSAVVATAAQLLQNCGKRLNTLSAVLPEASEADITDERYYMGQFREWENIDIEYITDAWRGPFDDLERVVWGAEAPTGSSRHYLYTAFAEAVRRKQGRVLLDGLFGELGPSFHGDGYLAELLMRGQWKTLIRELHCKASRENLPLFSILRGEVLKPILPLSLLRGLRPQAQYDFQQRMEKMPLQQAFVHRHLGSEMRELRATVYAMGKPAADHRKNQMALITHRASRNLSTFVGYEHVSPAFPFLDKRVLEFCLAVPGHLKVQNGFKRYLLRAGLDKILPPEIQWRTSKGPFSPDYYLRYNRQREQVQTILSAISPTDMVREIVDVQKLKRMAAAEMTGNRNTHANFATMHLVPQGIFLIYFLRQFDRYRSL